MERLTTKGYKYNSLDFMDDGMHYFANKLSRYEDTGLTPEEIIDGKLRTGWIPVSEWLPEDTYSSAEMMNEWFLITTPYGEMKLVQRQKCVPEGFIWFDGYNSYGAVAWKKEELYKID